MRWNRPNSIGKTVEVKATNRPVKIAYLVPFDDTPNTHMNLDAVFFESYTRWAGVYTLVIPTKAEEFLFDGYDEWLKHYDPDFIYSYVDLSSGFIEKIDWLGCPIAFLRHNHKTDRDIDWRSYRPNWERYIHPVSSMSTVQSPASTTQLPNEERSREPTVFTQYGMEPTNRFLADNFGTGFDLHSVTHAIPGLFKTLCLVPTGLSDKIVAGTKRCFSTLEAFRAISDHTATPISRLAMANSAGTPCIESMDWALAFRLFIGSTSLDRIHFWNSRHLGRNWSNTSNALILEPAFFDDDELVKQLGQYLNKNNFLGSGNGQYQARIHSSSMKAGDLNAIRSKLQPHTWNEVHVTKSFNSSPLPRPEDIKRIPSPQDLKRICNKSTDTTTLKLTEDDGDITASEPAHFIYMPPQLRGHAQGQWIVELNIQRHNNLSKYANVIDSWTLPRRRKITGAFTKRLAKPTLGGHLALVPSTGSFPSGSQSIKNPRTYEIQLPSDETFFRYLALEYFEYPNDDLRAPIPRMGYKNLSVSDKGQNLRGVISLFDQLSTAYGILTIKYWRSVLENAKEDSAKPLSFDMNKLDSLIPKDNETIRRIIDERHFDNAGATHTYLRNSLKDTLEHLIRLNVFYKVAHWRCRYCGRLNSRSFDSMKIKNECDICATEYFAPLDIEWKYELNDFVYRSLQKHSGLPVLWTLGYLQDRLHAGDFWYLPEVDLYERDDDPESKNEIDILCMLDGMFYAGEVKRSASVFLNVGGSLDKFVNIIKMLRPDVALLSFEKYCNQGEDEEAMRKRLTEATETIGERIAPWSKLKVLVAQDVAGFNDFSADLGWYGPRIHNHLC